MVHVPSTVHKPLAYEEFAVATKLRKLGETVDDPRSHAWIGRSLIANTSGPGSLTLCFGWTPTLMKLPTSPGVSV